MQWDIIEADADIRHYINQGPDASIWPDDEQKLRQKLYEIFNTSSISEQIKTDFSQFLVASFLLSPSDKTIPMCIFDYIPDQSCVGVQFPLQEMKKWKWVRVPIPLAPLIPDASGTIVHALVGMISDFTSTDAYPELCNKFLDDTARGSVIDVFQYVKGANPSCSFFFFPVLITPTDGGRSICGASLGLPVYLGCLALLKGVASPRNIIATGKVTCGGKLENVDGLLEKISAAALRNIDAFIYPNISSNDPLDSYKGVTTRIPVNTLELACLNWLGFTPGHGVELARFFNLVTTPILLAKNLISIPDFLIPLPENLKLDFRSKLQELPALNDISAFDALRTLQATVKTTTDQQNWPVTKIRTILELLDSDLIEQIAQKWVNAAAFDESGCGLAFDFALMHLIVANHCGEVPEANYWYQKANSYWEMKSGIRNKSRLLLYVNSMIIADHNRFKFLPRIPGDILLEDIENVIGLHEKRFAEDREEDNTVISDELARYYGSMMQQYAFCGSRYLPETLSYSQKAITAFAGTHDPTKIDSSRRQYCYQVYAYLDAALMDEAEDALLKYCGIESLEHINPETFREDYFQHAVLARFMADTGVKQQLYAEYIRENIDLVPLQHPIQLWLYNAGKIVDDIELKRRAWERSVKACFKYSNSVTIPVMALLPLSSLAHLKLYGEVELKPLAERAFKAIKHKDIYHPHFQKLLDIKNRQKVLAEVYAEPAEYFPFSYR